MSTDQNKMVVRSFVEEILNNKNQALVDELLAPDYVNHLVPGGREAFRQFWSMMWSTYPDFKVHGSIEHQVAEADYVVTRLTFRVENGDKEASVSSLSEHRVVDGKIVEDWPVIGAEVALQQVGIALPPA